MSSFWIYFLWLTLAKMIKFGSLNSIDWPWPYWFLLTYLETGCAWKSMERTARQGCDGSTTLCFTLMKFIWIAGRIEFSSLRICSPQSSASRYPVVCESKNAKAKGRNQYYLFYGKRHQMLMTSIISINQPGGRRDHILHIFLRGSWPTACDCPLKMPIL